MRLSMTCYDFWLSSKTPTLTIGNHTCDVEHAHPKTNNEWDFVHNAHTYDGKQKITSSSSYLLSYEIVLVPIVLGIAGGLCCVRFIQKQDVLCVERLLYMNIISSEFQIERMNEASNTAAYINKYIYIASCSLASRQRWQWWGHREWPTAVIMAMLFKCLVGFVHSNQVFYKWYAGTRIDILNCNIYMNMSVRYSLA